MKKQIYFFGCLFLLLILAISVHFGRLATEGFSGGRNATWFVDRGRSPAPSPSRHGSPRNETLRGSHNDFEQAQASNPGRQSPPGNRATPQVRSRLFQEHLLRYLLENSESLSSKQRRALWDASQVDWGVGWGLQSQTGRGPEQDESAAYRRHLERLETFELLSSATEALKVEFPRRELVSIVPFEDFEETPLQWMVNRVEVPFHRVTGSTFHSLNRAFVPYRRRAWELVSVVSGRGF